jgi:hypothetical protein
LQDFQSWSIWANAAQGADTTINVINNALIIHFSK